MAETVIIPISPAQYTASLLSKEDGPSEVSAELTPVSKCCLKKQCYERVLADTQNQLFNHFWRIGDYAKQNYYLVGLMAAQTPKLATNRPMKKNKTLSWKYWVDIRGRKVQVCKGFFLAVYGVSDKRLRVLQTKLVNGDPLEDQRGKYDKERRSNQHSAKRKLLMKAAEDATHSMATTASGPSKTAKRGKNSVNLEQTTGGQHVINEVIIPQSYQAFVTTAGHSMANQ